MYLSPNDKPINATVNDFVNRVNQDMTWADDSLILDDHYVFNQDFYRSRQDIYAGYHATVILQIAIVLPFTLPFTSPFSLPFWLTEATGSYGTFLFTPFTDDKRFLCGFLPQFGVTYQHARSRCEVVAMLRQDSVITDIGEVRPLELARLVRDAKHEGRVSGEDFVGATRQMFTLIYKLLDSAAAVVNSIIMSYAVKTKDDAVFAIELASLEHASHFRIIEAQNWETYNWMIVSNTRFPKDPYPPLDQDTVGRVFGGSQYYLRNPEVQYAVHLQRAIFEWQNGSSTNCMMYLVLSTEVLIRAIFRLYLENEMGMTAAGAKDKIEDTPFKRMLSVEMHPILGGNWNLTDPTAPAGEWYNGPYSLRNRIVHGGYSPKDMEILSAIGANNRLLEDVLRRVKERRRKRPYLSAVFPTPPSTKVIEKGLMSQDGQRA
jgi:hypothetical protein